MLWLLDLPLVMLVLVFSPQDLDSQRLSEHLILRQPMKGHPVSPGRGGTINDGTAGHGHN